MTSTTTAARSTGAAPHPAIERVPPHVYFVGSAVFHYLGPAFAVLLFARVEALGVAWLRIASAAVVFAAWRRPWRMATRVDRSGRRLLLAWGAVLAVMNCCFYLAIDRLPLGTVAAIEFLPVVALAALGARTARNGLAIALAVPGVYLLCDVQLAGAPLGVALAFANALGFALYIVLAHRVARHGGVGGLDGLAAAMLVAGGVGAALAGGGGLRRVGGAARAGRPGRAARGRRRRDLLVGHPVRVRPARDAPARARDVRAHGGAAAGDRDGDRRRRARPDAVGDGARRGRARHRGRRRAP